MASSNSGGAASDRTYEKRTMDYFDRLPRSVRAAVADARFNWAIHSWLMQFERGQIKTAELVKRVNEVDRTEAAKTRARTWGADYPILKGELPHAPRQPRKARR